MARGGKPKISFRILEIHPEAWKKKKKKGGIFNQNFKALSYEDIKCRNKKKKSRPIPELVLYFSKSICNKS